MTASVATAADLVVAQVRARAHRRVRWLRALWADQSAAGHAVVAHAEIDGWLAGRDREDVEAAWQAEDPDAVALGAVAAAAAAEVLAPEAALGALARLFGLDRGQLDLLTAAAAVALDPDLPRVCAYLADDARRPYLTEELAARLFGHGRRRWLVPESALARWELIHRVDTGPAESPALVCDPLIRDWLTGERRLDEPLVGVAGIVAPPAPLPSWPVEEVAARVHALVPRGPVVVRVSGTLGSGRRSFAAAVAARLGLPLLAIDADAIDDGTWPLVVRRAHRQAFLDASALGWIGDGARRRPPALPAAFPVQFVIAETGDPPVAVVGAAELSVSLPGLTVAERRHLWSELVPGAAGWPGDELAVIAARHRTTVGEIARVGASQPTSADDAGERIRAANRHRLGELARAIDCPFAWDDLVVPAPIERGLRELVFEARDRATFWELPAARRLFPHGQGLFALFTGSPGTGKTMAAQVIAATLGLDLFRISLATVVSKYVGETAKNLQRVLARAEELDCVLLFDEADALFARRTEVNDAHDRFANTDTNYLLQAIEAYRGVAILATNKRSNIDPAFVRRLRYVLDFPRPDAADRRTLWGRLIGELAGVDRAIALAPHTDAIARSVEATGAQIKHAVLAAMFAARADAAPLDHRHLLRGLERELAKDGRALDERDRERLAHG